MHLVASTFNPPSAVLHSLACSFQGSDERYLVVCKTNNLEVHALRPHGTELVCEQEIWGAPKGLAQLESSKHLVLALDIPQARIIILEYKPQSAKLHVHHTTNVSPLTHRPSVNYSGVIVNDQIVCAAFYNGHVKVLEIDTKDPYRVTEVHELTIQSMCFTLPASNHVVAIAYTDRLGNGRLIARKANTLDPDVLIPDKSLEFVPDRLIPVKIATPSQEPTYGLLLVSEKNVTFLNTGAEPELDEPQSTSKGKGRIRNRSKSEIKAALQASAKTVAVPFQDVTAWTQVDDTHLAVGNSFGQLYLLTMSMEPEFTLKTTLLGQVSVPSTLSYLSNNILYVGSYSAPSQLVRISENISLVQAVPEAHGKSKRTVDDAGEGGHLEVMATHNENIAPILDAILIDSDGSGQARIAAVSGDDSGGALHVIYRGASFRESAILDDLPNLENLFAFKKYHNAPDHAYLAATTNTDTFLFSLSPTQLTLLTAGDLASISRTSRTLLLANLNLPGQDAVIHVTPNHASVVDLVTGRSIGSWSPPRGDITAAAVDTVASVVCVSTSQGGLYCLGVQAGGIARKSERSFSSKPHSQISALAVSQGIVLATFWGSNETLLLDLSNLQFSKATPSTEPSAATSAVLSNFGENQLYSVIARLDGALVVQAISSEGIPLPNTRRVVPLGGGPISLAFVATQGNTSARVIAAGKQAVALSIVNKRLNVSSLPVTGVCAVSALEAVEMRSSVVYASATGLVFGQIEQLDKLNITSHNLGTDSPICINHHPQLSAYIVGCMRVMTNLDNERYFLRFLDDSTFDDLGQVKLQYQEVVYSIAPYSYAGESCILVGTGTIHVGENEARNGRIMLFKADAKTRTFKLENKKDVEGQVSSIKQFKQRIIAAVNDRVLIFNLENDGGILSIGDPLAKWERAYSIETIVIRGDTIVVGDKLRSVSVLRVFEKFADAPGEVGEDEMEIVEQKPVSVELQTVAMDMSAVWPCAVEALDDGKTIIAAQLDGNILTWELDEGRLEARAAFYVGEIINKFVILPPRTSSNTRPVALFVTNSGRIGMLSTVDDEDAIQLTRLELKMDKVIKGLGGMRYSDWRSPKLLSSFKKPPPRRGITDGDYIKKFLELDDESAKKILSEGSAAEQIEPANEERIRRCLEALSVDHVYLLVFRSPVFPAHWALWVPRLENPDIGKIISAVGDPSTSFVHEFQRNFSPASPSSMLPILLCDTVKSKHIIDGELGPESTIDAHATDDLENVALAVPPPGKSLNSVADSGAKRRVAINNCQTWMREYVVKLVGGGILDALAVDVLDGAPRN
ncbi:hypothetical protein FRC07_003723 [Ceratobasidium sp. 392]|nr:hypothetical protein FRC07_003723 [Ceratobasidium sp. 392]